MQEGKTQFFLAQNVLSMKNFFRVKMFFCAHFCSAIMFCYVNRLKAGCVWQYKWLRFIVQLLLISYWLKIHGICLIAS